MPAEQSHGSAYRRLMTCSECSEEIEIGDRVSHNIEKHGCIDFKNLPSLKKSEMVKNYMTHYETEARRSMAAKLCDSTCGLYRS